MAETDVTAHLTPHTRQNSAKKQNTRKNETVRLFDFSRDLQFTFLTFHSLQSDDVFQIPALMVQRYPISYNFNFQQGGNLHE